MGNKIVVYKSNTGLTKKYAEWIAAALDCEAIPLKQATRSRLAEFATVIFGGQITRADCRTLIGFCGWQPGRPDASLSSSPPGQHPWAIRR